MEEDSKTMELVAKPKPISRRNSLEAKYVCSFEGCGLRFPKMDLLDRHEFHHTGVKKHFCLHEGCNKVYTTLTILKRHFKLSHEESGKPKKLVSCRVKDCKQTFTNVYNMLRHIREVHDNAKIYFCKYCRKKFTQKLKMRRHEIKEHTGVYPYTCLKCNKGFYQKYTYERHIPVCQVYDCPGCDLSFAKWSVYRKHCIETQHGRTYYECEHCQRLYKKPGELKRHLSLKHMDEIHQPSFKCSVEGCNRSYSYERNLKQHTRVAHSKERFACLEPGCKKDFSSAQNLAKHKQKVHEENPDELVVPEKKPKKDRQRRKDAGKTKVSQLAILANIVIDKETDSLIRARDEQSLNQVSKMLQQLLDQDSENESNGFTLNVS